MVEKSMEKVATTVWVRNYGIVTIPKRIRDKLGIEIGDQVKIVVEKFPAPESAQEQAVPM